MKSRPTGDVVAYSYLRFSDPKQSDGDSVRRQTALRDAWLKRYPHVRLDTSLALKDQGVSGYTGKHRTNTRHALAQFLDLVERGKVHTGSYLIVENLDRLTRENPVISVPAVLNLIAAGIRVVQLVPVEIVYDGQMEQHTLMNMLWELARGNAESKRKSGLCGAAWSQKKNAARADKTPHGGKCPAWLEGLAANDLPARPGETVVRYRVKEDAAKSVRRVFELSASGLGICGMLAKLHAEKVPPIGPSGLWVRSYIRKLLTEQTVLGTYRPMKRGGPRPTPDGEPIEGYYPAIITPEQWYAANQAMKGRKNKSGRPAKAVPNPFAGLLRCALDDCQLHLTGRGRHKYLISAKALQKTVGSSRVAFPLSVFTKIVLAQLSELKAADLFSDPGAAALVELTGRLAEVERRLAAAVVQFDADPESQQWQSLVTKYDREKRTLVKELAEERQRAANPLSATWVEAVELMARDEPAQLRAALMSVVEGVHCVFVGVGFWKLAAVQVQFRGGGVRHYLIMHLSRRGRPAEGAPSETKFVSFKDADMPDAIDLRKPADVATVEKFLTAVDVEKLGKEMAVRAADATEPKEKPAEKKKGKK